MKIIYTILILLSLGVLVFIFRPSGIEIELINASKTTIKESIIKYHDGQIPLKNVVAGRSKSVRLPKEAESPLVVLLKTNSTANLKKEVDVYFERGYSGSIILKLDSNNDLTWESTIKIGTY